MPDKEILILCPSRERPALCARMLKSLKDVSKCSSVRLLLDMDDPTLEEYRALCGRLADSIVIDFRKPITELINNNFMYSADCFGFFSVSNDDFVYKTDGWDEKLIASMDGKPGIAYGNDMMQGKNLPTTSVISREIPEALGWLQMPTLTHLFGDTVWLHLGIGSKCLYYNHEVVIEHHHYFNNKAPQDAIYKQTNGKAMYDRDMIAFLRWKAQQLHLDISTINGVIADYHSKRALTPKE